MRNKILWPRAGAPPRFVRDTGKESQTRTDINRYALFTPVTIATRRTYIVISKFRYAANAFRRSSSARSAPTNSPPLAACSSTGRQGYQQHLETLAGASGNLDEPDIQERLDEIRSKLERDRDRQDKLIVNLAAQSITFVPSSVLQHHRP